MVLVQKTNLDLVACCELKLWLFKAQPIGRERGWGLRNYISFLLVVLVQKTNLDLVACCELEL